MLSVFLSLTDAVSFPVPDRCCQLSNYRVTGVSSRCGQFFSPCQRRSVFQSLPKTASLPVSCKDSHFKKSDDCFLQVIFPVPVLGKQFGIPVPAEIRMPIFQPLRPLLKVSSGHWQKRNNTFPIPPDFMVITLSFSPTSAAIYFNWISISFPVREKLAHPLLPPPRGICLDQGSFFLPPDKIIKHGIETRARIRIRNILPPGSGSRREKITTEIVQRNCGTVPTNLMIVILLKF